MYYADILADAGEAFQAPESHVSMFTNELTNRLTSSGLGLMENLLFCTGR